MATSSPWNYTTGGTLPPVISPEQYQIYTDGVMSSSDDKINATLRAVSSAIRIYCGWHVAPNLRCLWEGDSCGRLVELPAMNVTNVHSVTVNGRKLNSDEFSWRKSGLIRLAKDPGDDWGQLVSVDFSAGIDPGFIAPVAAQIATNAIVAPAGVQSERAGDVSIQYNQLQSGVSGGIRLLASDKELLNSFKLTAGV